MKLLTLPLLLFSTLAFTGNKSKNCLDDTFIDLKDLKCWATYGGIQTNQTDLKIHDKLWFESYDLVSYMGHKIAVGVTQGCHRQSIRIELDGYRTTIYDPTYNTTYETSSPSDLVSVSCLALK